MRLSLQLLFLYLPPALLAAWAVCFLYRMRLDAAYARRTRRALAMAGYGADGRRSGEAKASAANRAGKRKRRRGSWLEARPGGVPLWVWWLFLRR